MVLVYKARAAKICSWQPITTVQTQARWSGKGSSESCLFLHNAASLILSPASIVCPFTILLFSLSLSLSLSLSFLLIISQLPLILKISKISVLEEIKSNEIHLQFHIHITLYDKQKHAI